MKIFLWYYKWNDKNYLDDDKSPVFEITKDQLLFLNFITSIREDNLTSFDIKNSSHKANEFLEKHINNYTHILESFKEENDLDTNILDDETLSLFIDYLDMEGYVPYTFWDYDSISDVNSNGLSNGNGVLAYEIVEE